MSTPQSGSPVQAPGGPIRAVLAAVALSIAGLAASVVTTLPAIAVDPTLADSPAEASDVATIAYLILSFVGYAVAGAAYLRWTGRGWDWLDVEWPTRRGWKYVVFGIVGSIGFLIAVTVAAALLDLSTTENQVMTLIGDDPNMVLIMIVIVFAFNAPAEEFLFRNVVQKRLYAAFNRAGAVVVASLIFAVLHFPSYALAADGSLAPLGAIATSLAVVFGGALIFGAVYARTDNLLVPTAAHAMFNAVQFGLLYLALRYAPEQLETSTSVLELLPAAVPF